MKIFLHRNIHINESFEIQSLTKMFCQLRIRLRQNANKAAITVNMLALYDVFPQTNYLLPYCFLNTSEFISRWTTFKAEVHAYAKQNMFLLKTYRSSLSRGVLIKKYFENMQQIYRRTTVPNCDFNFNKVAKQTTSEHSDDD